MGMLEKIFARYLHRRWGVYSEQEWLAERAARKAQKAPNEDIYRKTENNPPER